MFVGLYDLVYYLLFISFCDFVFNGGFSWLRWWGVWYYQPFFSVVDRTQLILNWGKGLSLVGVIRMCFTLVFGSGFIFGIGGHISNLFDFSLGVFILVRDFKFSVELFGQWSEYSFWVLFVLFQLSVIFFSFSWNFGLSFCPSYLSESFIDLVDCCFCWLDSSSVLQWCRYNLSYRFPPFFLVLEKLYFFYS